MSNLSKYISRCIDSYGVLVFSKGDRNNPACPYCERAIAKLDEENIEFKLIDVIAEGVDKGLEQAVKDYAGYLMFPQIYIHGKLVGGFDDLMRLHKTGELRKKVLQDTR